MSDTAMYIIWAVAIFLFGALEGVTTQLVSIWFMLGAIGALIAALCHTAFLVQIIVFIAITVITLAATRPIVRKKLNVKFEKTNADRCIGQDAIVIEEINNLLPQGQVKVDGKVWTARSSVQDKTIPQNAVVRVEKIDGVKLIVSTK